MTEQAKHTATPWAISKIGNNYDEYMIYSEEGANVCNTVYSEVDADFIVKACNMHEKLFELARIVTYSQEWDGSNQDKGRWSELYRMARDLVKNANA